MKAFSNRTTTELYIPFFTGLKTYWGGATLSNDPTPTSGTIDAITPVGWAKALSVRFTSTSRLLFGLTSGETELLKDCDLSTPELNPVSKPEA